MLIFNVVIFIIFHIHLYSVFFRSYPLIVMLYSYYGFMLLIYSSISIYSSLLPFFSSYSIDKVYFSLFDIKGTFCYA